MHIQKSFKIILDGSSIGQTSLTCKILFLFLIKMKIFIFFLIFTLFATVYAQFSDCDDEDDKKCQLECENIYHICKKIARTGRKACTCHIYSSAATNLNHCGPILGLIMALNIFKFLRF